MRVWGYFGLVPSYYRDPHAPEPNVPRRIGVTALVERDGRFLVERRIDDPGVRAFIGGTLEVDELLVGALHREHAGLPFWPAQLPIRDALLADRDAPVIA